MNKKIFFLGASFLLFFAEILNAQVNGRADQTELAEQKEPVPVKKEETAAPVVGAPLPVVEPLSPFEILLEEGKKLAAQNRHYDASLLFHKILSEGEEGKNYFLEAQYELAKSLFSLKLYLSALSYFDRVVEHEASHPSYRDTLKWLLLIHKERPGDITTLERMSQYPDEFFPAEYSDEINFYVGQHHYYQMNFDRSLVYLKKVSKQNPVLYLKAQYLKGVVYVRQNMAEPASEAFKDILRYIAEVKESTDEIEKFRELAVLGIGRIFYSTQQFETAVKYYDQIGEKSEYWLESLFEKSWAYFQLNNFPRALGNLHTLSSPYFEEEYFPEGYVLKGLILFSTCNYEESLQVIDPFYKEYYGLLKELEQMLAIQEDPSEFYHYLAKVSAKGAEYSLRLKKLANVALADRRIFKLFNFIVQINKEISQLEEMSKHPLAKRLAEFLLPEIVSYRALVIREAGMLARERMLSVQKELKSVLSQALRIKFETLNAQKGALDEEVMEELVKRQDKLEEPLVDVEHNLWKFDGEYWRDELGSYYYPVQSRCK